MTPAISVASSRPRDVDPLSRPDLHESRRVLGLDFWPATMAETVDVCDRAVHENRPFLIGVANAAKVVNQRKDPALREALLDCDVLLADGMSVVWASRVLGAPLPERVAGCDLFDRLLELADEHGHSIYFLGATSEVNAEVVATVRRRYPNAVIAGARDGYFTEAQSPEVAAEIQRAAPDILFLGITSPKKEIFLSRHGADLGASVRHGVGGSFDILAGHTRRAPEAFQRHGLEWLYRLLQEPRRMWKRYLVTNTAFIVMTVRALFRRERKSETTH